MPKYVTTELAGDYVAGRKNPGPGSPMTLSPEEADHDFRVGALRLWGEDLDEHKARAEAATAPDQEQEPQTGAETAQDGEPNAPEAAADSDPGAGEPPTGEALVEEAKSKRKK